MSDGHWSIAQGGEVSESEVGVVDSQLLVSCDARFAGRWRSSVFGLRFSPSQALVGKQHSPSGLPSTAVTGCRHYLHPDVCAHAPSAMLPRLDWIPHTATF